MDKYILALYICGHCVRELVFLVSGIESTVEQPYCSSFQIISFHFQIKSTSKGTQKLNNAKEYFSAICSFIPKTAHCEVRFLFHTMYTYDIEAYVSLNIDFVLAPPPNGISISGRICVDRKTACHIAPLTL